MGRDGQDCKLYMLDANVSSTPPVSGVCSAVPAGHELLAITDSALNGTVLSSFDTTARSDFVGTDGRGKAKFGVTFNIIDRDEVSADITTLQTAHMTGAEVPMAVLNGDKADTKSRGLVTNMKVHSFANGRPLNDKSTYDVEVRPSSYPGIKKSS